MRLICPNCDAQYEVADDAIPPGGRDVQCSNCGHAWYQIRPEEIEDERAQEALFDPPVAEPATPEEEPPAAPVWSEAEDEDEAPPASYDRPEPPKRRPIDDAVLDVLREEAEREAAARRAETHVPLETQPDLGLEAAPAAAPIAAAPLSPAARRIAQMKGIEADPEPPAPAGKPAKGRDLLPDIEEINSTLDPDAERFEGDGRRDPSMEPVAPRGNAFRTGFSLMVLIAVLATLTYVMAPKLSEQMPGLAGTLAKYTAFVDGLRMSLDQLVQSAARMLGGGA